MVNILRVEGAENEGIHYLRTFGNSDAIRADAEKGRTVLFATHYLEEAELLSKHLAILNEGKVLAVGTLDELVAKVQWPFRVAVTGRGVATEELASFGPSAAIGDSSIVFTTQGGAEELTRLALSRWHPDYVCLSFYKMFGWPTGAGPRRRSAG